MVNLVRELDAEMDDRLQVTQMLLFPSDHALVITYAGR